MISKSAKYAIKAVIYLAIHTDEQKKMLVRDMHREVNVSEAYLAKLLQELSRHGVISSAKGRGGGFFLSRENREHTLMDVLKVIEGGDSIHACVLGISTCDSENPCVLHHIVGPSKLAFNRVLESTTLGALAEGLPNQPLFPL